MMRLQAQRNVHQTQNSQDKSAHGSAKKCKRASNEDHLSTNKSNTKKTNNVKMTDKNKRLEKRNSLQNLPNPKKNDKIGKSLQNIAVKDRKRNRERNISPLSSKSAIKMNSSEYVSKKDRARKNEYKAISRIGKSYIKANSLHNLSSNKDKMRRRDLNESLSRKNENSDSSDESLLTHPKSNLIQSDTYNLTIDKRKRSSSKRNLDTSFSKRILRLVSHNTTPINKNKPKRLDHQTKLHGSDSKTKRQIISEVIKYNTKELKRNKIPLRETQTRESSFNRLLTASKHKYSDKKSELKRKVRRQVWHWAKKAIKNNEHWSSLFAENHINIDRINIDKLDLSLFDVDALEIENKLLKRTVVWLLK